jgi:hypothetical protein
MALELTLERLQAQRALRWNVFLDELKRKESIGSDSSLAETLGISRAFISAIRKSKRDMPDHLAEQIFLRLGRNLSMFEAVSFLPHIIIKRTNVVFAPRIAEESAIKKCEGKCELCGNSAPFESKSGVPYLEICLILTKTGKMSEVFEASLCPNCNQKINVLNSDNDKLKIRKNVLGR